MSPKKTKERKKRKRPPACRLLCPRPGLIQLAGEAIVNRKPIPSAHLHRDITRMSDCCFRHLCRQPIQIRQHTLGLKCERGHAPDKQTNLNSSNSRYALRYLLPRRYIFSARSGIGCTNVFPTRRVMYDESWKDGSNTISCLEPFLSFSKPMMVKEWPGTGMLANRARDLEVKRGTNRGAGSRAAAGWFFGYVVSGPRRPIGSSSRHIP